MYSEKIDNIKEQLSLINKELRELAGNIIKDIFSIQPEKHTLNVMYYTDSWVTNWDFLGIDGNGYGSALFIASIDYGETNPYFNMVNEDGDAFENRTLNDFDTTELTYLVCLLNDILDVARNEGKINSQMDWDY